MFRPSSMTLSRNKTNRPARRTAPKSVRRLYSAAALVETLESRMLLSVVDLRLRFH
jgi:hypothetical protein